jgi:anti-anti-sigma factor
VGQPTDTTTMTTHQSARPLSFLDSSCLHALLDPCRMAEEADGTLKLVSPQPVVARMMALSGADQLVSVHASVAEAAG